MPGMSIEPIVRTSFVALGEFVRNPAMVGSAFPASRRMVDRLLEPLDWSAIDVLLEYGPGTGRFTAEVLERMKPGATLIAIERGDEFVEHLRSSIRDHRLEVVHGSAGEVLSIMADRGIASADCVISGLPFSTLPKREAEHIVDATARSLTERGVFAAYQMRTAVLSFIEPRFGKVLKSFEWRNIPPCHLYWASMPWRAWPAPSC